MTDKPKAPRLQLRYERDDERTESWKCFYEIVVPLGLLDIRRERIDPETKEPAPDVDEAVAVFPGFTRIGRSSTPCYQADGTLYYDPPFRDGAHANWDAEKFGGLPVYCVTHDGKFIEKPEDWGKK